MSIDKLQKIQNEQNNDDDENFDPFTNRAYHTIHPTSDCQTLTHLIKSTLGTGIMAIPYAAMSAGLIGGIVGTILLGMVSTNASYILVKSAHILYVKARKKEMLYEDLAETAFALGPQWCRKYSNFVRKFVIIWLFLTYFGCCVADNLVISTNYGQVYKYYYLKFSNGSNFNATAAAIIAMEPVGTAILRSIMACCIVPLVLLVWIPDFKYLAPISTISNFIMATVLLITSYYLVQNPKPISELKMIGTFSDFPTFFGITIYSLQNVGVLMPLENKMMHPEHFVGYCGVLNRAMSIITTIYIVFGALGYSKYGDGVNVIITTNLPIADITGQIVKFLIATCVLLTFALQFYVCRLMVWIKVKHHFEKRPILAEYTIRALLVIICVSIAIVFPKIRAIITLVASLGFSFLGIICPAIVELLTYADIGYGTFHWKVYKNIVTICLGILALIAGTLDALSEMAEEFM